MCSGLCDWRVCGFRWPSKAVVEREGKVGFFNYGFVFNVSYVY